MPDDPYAIAVDILMGDGMDRDSAEYFVGAERGRGATGTQIIPYAEHIVRSRQRYRALAPLRRLA